MRVTIEITQTSLLDELDWEPPQPPVADFQCADDYETPDDVARFMAGLIQLGETNIVEIGAGGGQITQYLPTYARAIESNAARVARGRNKAPGARWVEEDFFHWASRHGEALEMAVDVFIANPPFSIALDLMEVALPLLGHNGRFVLLLPTEFFQAQARAQQLGSLGLVISQEWRIAGRVHYLKNGVPQTQRQCYDSIFELRPAAAVKPQCIAIIDPMGRLG